MMRIGHQSPPVDGRLFHPPQRAVACKLTKQFHTSRDITVIRDGEERQLGVHDDAPHDFSISLPREDIVTVCDHTPFLVVLMNVITTARPLVPTKASTCRLPIPLSVSRPYAPRTLNTVFIHVVLVWCSPELDDH